MRKDYTWSQNYDEVDVKINLPAYIKKSKQVNIQIEKKHLLVEIDDENSSNPRKKIINCELQHEVRQNGDSTLWCMDAGKTLDVSVNFYLLKFGTQMFPRFFLHKNVVVA